MTPSFPFITSPLLYNKAEIESLKERTNKGNNELNTNMSVLIEMGFWVSSQWVSQVTLKIEIRLPLNLSAISTSVCSPLLVCLSSTVIKRQVSVSVYVQQVHKYWFYFLSTCLFGLHILDSCRCSLEWLSIWAMALALIPFQILLKWASRMAYHTLNCLIISADPCRGFSTSTWTAMKEN